MRSLSSIALAVLWLGLLIACTPGVPTSPPPTAVSHVILVTSTRGATSVPSSPTPIATTGAAPAAAASTLCPRPADWSAYRVTANDTIYSLARELSVTVESIMQANCLPTDLLQIGQELYLPLSTCTAITPTGWIKYVVHEGDTLAALALIHNVALKEVQQANCLQLSAANNLTIGQVLLLPPLPPVAEPPVIEPPIVSVAEAGSSAIAPAPLNVEKLKVPQLRLVVGEPAENFVPCTSTQTTPIDWFDPNKAGPVAVQVIGTSQYYFPCGFGKAGIVQAILTGPDGLTPVRIISEVPDPDQVWNEARGRPAAVLGAICKLEPGPHLLRIWDSLGHQAELKIELTSPEFAGPLVLPPGGSIGTPFEAFWCGYADRAGNPIQFGLYRETGKDANKDRVFTGVAALSVTIDVTTGWASLALPPAALNVTGAYVLAEDNPDVGGNLPTYEFWVKP
jgi:LysM repeat protein